MKNIRFLAFALSLGVLTACGGGNGQQDQQASESVSEEELAQDPSQNGQKSQEPEFSPEEVNMLLQSIPSPLETTRLIKALGARYKATYLNQPQRSEQYATEFDQAVNLGIYGTDLGYINIYNRQQEVLDYLDVVTQLANKLNVGKFFNLKAMQRLVSNKANTDSLLYITTSGFDEMTTYLNEQGRSKVSVAIITAGWIEGMYLITQVAELNPSEQLDEKVGEQKVVLENILELTKLFEGKNDSYAMMHEELKAMQAVYDNVTIEYQDSEAGGTANEAADEDMLMVEGSQQSIVNITPEQVAQIGKITDRLRTKLVKP